MEVSLIGQSTLLIRMSGISMMTDPWWGQFEFIRAVPVSMDPEKIDNLDLMLVSHNHIDHWSDPAIKLAARLGSEIIGSKKAVERARKRGLKNLKALLPGESCEYKGLKILAVPADHPFAPDAIGFVVKGEQTFYFCGDTRYTPLIRKALTGIEIDVAFLQVACSNYPFIGKDGMEIPDVIRFAEELKPKVVVPVHYQVKGKVLDSKTLRSIKLSAKLAVLEPGSTCVI
jgi:L-ascorbate metabolism protein UlaG (beta-lactamase superfamily)